MLIGFANRLARRMSQHNGYKTLNEHSTLAQLHPSTAPLATDEYGLTPDYLIYTSLVATARVFLSKVGACCLSASLSYLPLRPGGLPAVQGFLYLRLMMTMASRT